MTVQLPEWTAYLAGIGSPIAALVGGAIVGPFVARRAARELESRSRREQVLQTLQWAAELALKEDVRQATFGVEMLRVLAGAELADAQVQEFVLAGLAIVLDPTVAELKDDPSASATGSTAGSAPVGGADPPVRPLPSRQRAAGGPGHE